MTSTDAHARRAGQAIGPAGQGALGRKRPSSVVSISSVAHADDAPATPPASAANDASHDLPTEGSVVAGLTQWLLFRGGNIGGELRIGRLALEVSHGQGLNLNEVPGLALSSAERATGAHVFVPWTTGFGVGLRITRDLTALVEAKAHHYNVTGNDARHEVDYTTFSVGPSVFYTVHIYKGLFLEPNVRFWPNVASTLKGNRAAIVQSDGSIYEHQAHDFGLFANMNVGWTF